MSAGCEALVFEGAGERLVGVLHRPQPALSRGVLIVVGGPQYRAGSHRQFVLLARALSDAGYPALRFDQRGVGDSDGEEPGFEHIDEDIEAALQTFFARCDGLSEVVVWGLCDAASAAMFYALRSDPRVTGLVLLNPWVRTEATLARTQLKHYYLSRLLAGEFWRRLLGGRLNVAAALGSLAQSIRRSLSGAPSAAGAAGSGGQAYPQRMAQGLAAFPGRTLLILSGDDLTAAEFSDTAKASAQWRRALARETVEQRRLEAANHTFSRREWRDQVAQWTLEWLKSW